MAELENGSVRFVMTSPPYWNLKDYKISNQIGQEEYDVYLRRLNKVWDECYRVTKPNGLLAINIGSRRANGQFYPIGFDIYRTMSQWKLIDTLIWYIPNALPQPKHYMNLLFDNKYESILLFAKNYNYDYYFHKLRVKQKYAGKDLRTHKLNPNGRGMANIFRIPAYRPPNIKKRAYHVAAFPEKLVYLFLSAYTSLGDTVLDPFLGSGTTLKVSLTMGRKGIGFEINPKFRELIRERLNESWSVPPLESLDIISWQESEDRSSRKGIFKS